MGAKLARPVAGSNIEASIQFKNTETVPQKNKPSVWTDKKIEQLKTLWAAGKSASVIAAEMGGISRNAVIGKVHRLDLEGRKTAVAAKRNPKPERRAPMKRPRLHAFPSAPSFQKTTAERLRVAEKVDVKHLSLEELGVDMCHYPLGDGPFTFCGCATRKDRAYCDVHYDLTHTATSGAVDVADKSTTTQAA